MNKEMSDKTLDARTGPNERSTGDIEHLLNLRQPSPKPVPMAQLPNGTKTLEMKRDWNPQMDMN